MAAAGARTQPAPALRRLSYQQLRRATGSFEVGSKLGQGGFGLGYSLMVYSVQPEAYDYEYSRNRLVFVRSVQYVSSEGEGYGGALKLMREADVSYY
jgi:hypothetical protein